MTTELTYSTTFQLLVAVMLSAQCTDKRVNMVTPALFERFPDAARMAEADFGEVLALVSSVSYPNAKSQHLIDMARMLMEKHGGEVPHTLDELTALPGVGRKTANVMLHFLAERNIFVSSGSACGKAKPSHVLSAMQLPKEQ